MYPFSRDLPDPTGYGPPQPSSSSSSWYRPKSTRHFSRLQWQPVEHRYLPSVSVSGCPGRSTNPLRKIAPPDKMETQVKLELSAAAKEHNSPFDQANAYIQECRAWRKGSPTQHPLRPFEDYETPVAIKMSGEDWVKLSSELNSEESDEAYPRLSYNASTSTLIIQCMPTPLHQSICTILTEEFILSKAQLPANLRQQTEVISDQNFVGFRGPWKNSGKRPDFGIQVADANGDFEIKWVLEVGFSESYDDLKEDARLWLEGYPEISMVTMVKFLETPQYRRPIEFDDDDDEDKLEALGIPINMQDIKQADVTMVQQSGPATYQGYQWVGQITEIFMENWIRDNNGSAIKHDNRRNILQTAGKINIPVGSFLPAGYPQTIVLDSNYFRSKLSHKIKELAVNRCREWVKEYTKRMEMRQHDGNYQP